MPFPFGLIVGDAAAVQVPVGFPPCVSALCQSEALAPFYARLRTRGGAPVHIIQIGDSHTAGDAITNGLRMPLQSRFGNGGRGVLAPGRPYDGYMTWNVTAAQSPGWRVGTLFGSGYRAGAPLGISGFTQTARSAGETLSVTADAPEHSFDRITVCAATGRGAGTLSLRLGNAVETWPLEAAQRGAACRSLDSDTPVSAASVTTLDDRPVSVTSFATFRRGSGVVVSNLGVIGAQLSHFGRTDDRIVRAELEAYRPDLIILAFGTNEGFATGVSAGEFEAGLRAQIERVRRLAGRAVPIMLLGAPDAATRNAALGGSSCGDGLHTPAFLGAVRARQCTVARELGLAFWDWEAAMGGRCASRRWFATGRMRADHVHFTRDGGDRIGRLLHDDLERAATSAPAQPRPRTSPATDGPARPDPTATRTRRRP